MFGIIKKKIKKYIISVAEEERAKEKDAKNNTEVELTKKTTVLPERVLKRNYIPSGGMRIYVFGTQYDNPQKYYGKIKKLVGKGEYTATLTPQSKYQVEHEWPEPPFVNVNLPGSFETNKDNWLGYIASRVYWYDFEYMVNHFGTIDVKMKVAQRKDDDDIFTVYIDESFFKKYSVEHDPDQAMLLDRITTKHEDLPVEIDYDKVTYKGYVLGTLSLKVAEDLKDKAVSCRLDLFRWNDPGNNKHYSRMFCSFPPLPSK